MPLSNIEADDKFLQILTGFVPSYIAQNDFNSICVSVVQTDDDSTLVYNMAGISKETINAVMPKVCMTQNAPRAAMLVSCVYLDAETINDALVEEIHKYIQEGNLHTHPSYQSVILMVMQSHESTWYGYWKKNGDVLSLTQFEHGEINSDIDDFAGSLTLITPKDTWTEDAIAAAREMHDMYFKFRDTYEDGEAGTYAEPLTNEEKPVIN